MVSMSTNWRIGTVNGALLACYFIPSWAAAAYNIFVSPIQGLYDRPNISVALFMSDYMHLAAVNTVRLAWLLALSKMTVVAFLTVFLLLTTRASIRKSGECDEALALALAIGSLISFASMFMASMVGETAALRLHATELLLLLGAAILMVFDPPFQGFSEPVRQWPPKPVVYPFTSR